MQLVILFVAAFGFAFAFDQHQHSPYADFQSREIKALSKEDTDALLRGEGMQLALAAELNRYPGPKHVLELADQLVLSSAQRTAVQKMFDSMRTEAVRLGADIVEAERKLDSEFKRKTINREALRQATAEIGQLQGRLRAAHLEAHIAVSDVLTGAQQQKYEALRGYR